MSDKIIAYLLQEDHLFYKLETGKVTAVNTQRNWVKLTACVPAIYAEKLKVISKEEFDKAKKSTGL